MNKTLLDYFADLPDPRVERTKLHKLEDILVITICAVICGAEGWNEIELFGQCKQPWLKTFLELPNGIPSHDTFARVVSSIKPDDFEQRFQKWIQALAQSTGEKIIAIDGTKPYEGRLTQPTAKRRFIWLAHGPARIKWSLAR
jgi:predicted transposase YbfD/YdcC